MGGVYFNPAIKDALAAATLLFDVPLALQA